MEARNRNKFTAGAAAGGSVCMRKWETKDEDRKARHTTEQAAESKDAPTDLPQRPIYRKDQPTANTHLPT